MLGCMPGIRIVDVSLAAGIKNCTGGVGWCTGGVGWWHVNL